MLLKEKMDFSSLDGFQFLWLLKFITGNYPSWKGSWISTMILGWSHFPNSNYSQFLWYFLFINWDLFELGRWDNASNERFGSQEKMEFSLTLTRPSLNVFNFYLTGQVRVKEDCQFIDDNLKLKWFTLHQSSVVCDFIRSLGLIHGKYILKYLQNDNFILKNRFNFVSLNQIRFLIIFLTLITGLDLKK